MKKIILLTLLVTIVLTTDCKKEKKSNNLGLVALLALGGGPASSSPGINTPNASATITSFTPTSGAVGSTVRITGTNFNTAVSTNVVKFNGTTATVTAATLTELTVSVPTGARTGKITAEISGVTATSTDDFTVTCNPCRIFLTTTTYNGNLGGVTGGQSKCDSDFSKPTSGNFRALLRASNGTSSGNIIRGVSYTRVDGTVIVNSAFSNAYLVDPGLPTNTNAINTIAPASGPSTEAWLGYNGNSIGGNCQNWTIANTLATDAGFYIAPTIGNNENQIGDGKTNPGSCASLRRLICIEQ